MALRIENRSIFAKCWWNKLAKCVESGPSRCALNGSLGEDSLQCASSEIESHAVLLAGTDGTSTPFKVLQNGF